jgi:O-antigen ligase
VLILMGIPLLAISTIFTGSRAPLTIFGGSVLLLLTVNGLRTKSPWLRITTWLLVAGAVLGLALIASITSDKDFRHATEGRSHLWLVGLQKFVERPLFGYGYESWRDDLVSRLPGEQRDLTFEVASKLGAGYHNEYVSVLAEEGLIGAFGAALIIWLLLRSSWLLAFRRWATVHSQEWPLFAVIFLLLRANFEIPGLFGYAHDPADYLAYLLLAVVLSKFSMEEDYARLLAHRGTGSGS